MKRKHKETLKEIVAGAISGAILAAGFIYAMEVDAAGADTKLPKEYQMYCEEIGQDYGICPELLMAVIERESGGDADAIGKCGEVGLMQIYPKWHFDRAESLGIYNFLDPEGNIRIGADYLAELFAEYQDTGTALMVYNGTEVAEELGAEGIYTEYAESIMERTEQLERIHEKIAPSNTLASTGAISEEIHKYFCP